MQWIVIIINFYILIDMSRDPAGTEYMRLLSCLIDHSLRFHKFKGNQGLRGEDILLIFIGVKSEPAAN